jgi:hypothetical protein
LETIVVKQFFRSASLLLIAALAMLPSTRLLAQTPTEPTPFAVISIAPLDKILGDIEYITTAAGMAEVGPIARIATNPYIKGIDTKSPWGGWVASDPSSPTKVSGAIFLPVTNMKDVEAAIRSVGAPAPEDLGDGLKRFSVNGQSIYIKAVGSFAFIANDSRNLASVPKDPLALLGTLPKDYNLAIQVRMKNVPADQLKQVKDQIGGLLAASSGSGPLGEIVDEETSQKMQKMQSEQIVQFLDETEEFTVGLAIDSAAKKVHLDTLFTAKEGSDFASQIKSVAAVKSAFLGFLGADRAMTMNAASPFGPKDIERTQLMLKVARAGVDKSIDEDSDLPSDEARGAAKKLADKFFAIFNETVAAGKFDMGATVLLEGKVANIVAGVGVADGAKLAEALKDLAAFAKEDPNFPKIAFDSQTHKDVVFHTAKLPSPDEEGAKKIFGDEIEVVIGTGPKSAWVCIGQGATDQLKKLIDECAVSSLSETPNQFNLFATPILKFAGAVEDGNPITKALAEKADSFKGSDMITVRTTVDGRTTKTEISIYEGIFKIGGEVRTQVSGGGSSF